MKIRIWGSLLAAVLLCSACALSEQSSSVQEDMGTGFIKSDIGYYDSADTAIIVNRNEEENTITFLNTQIGKNYTLKYDGATEIHDKYNQGISMSQIPLGEIADITFVKFSKRLNSIQVSAKAWSYSDIEKFEFGRNNQIMKIGDEEYKLYHKVPIMSNNVQGEMMDLNASDTLTVKGIDHTVYSITVDKGHGYLRLANDQYFIGGWIEVGQKVIQPITENMLLVVPEGTYQVLLTNTRIEGTKQVTIERDGELELDVGDIKPEEIKYGKILFSINPSTASLYVDGELQDYTNVVTLEYGIHQMIVKADGYKTITQYIKVGQEKATINVELEAMSDSKNSSDETTNTGADTDTNDDSLIDANTQSSNNTVTQSASAAALNKVYIDSPEGAEVYFDSNYIGVAPTSFTKSAGTHIVSLRKTGYQTKSYTLQLDSTAKDITYSFAELVPSVSSSAKTD